MLGENGNVEGEFIFFYWRLHWNNIKSKHTFSLFTEKRSAGQNMNNFQSLPVEWEVWLAQYREQVSTIFFFGTTIVINLVFWNWWPVCSIKNISWAIIKIPFFYRKKRLRESSVWQWPRRPGFSLRSSHTKVPKIGSWYLLV